MLKRAINVLNFMVEAYPTGGRGYIYKDSSEPQAHLDRGMAVGKYDINVGASYSIWKDYINLIENYTATRIFRAVYSSRCI